MLSMTFEDSADTKQKSQDEFLLQLRKSIVEEVIQALKEVPKENGKSEINTSSNTK